MTAPEPHPEPPPSTTSTADEPVDLSAPEHAWWATPDDFVPIVDAPEHVWWASPTQLLPPWPRHTRSFDAQPLDDIAAEAARAATTPTSGPDGHADASAEEPRPSTGPYAVLRVPNDAPWDDIVAAYRRQVRWWHPDGLGDASAEERAACDARLRDLNSAFSELKIRRARA